MTICIIRKITPLLALILVSAGLTAQTVGAGSMPQYLFPEFSEGKILMKDGQMQTEMLNFNIVTERMVFIKDDKYWDLTNSDMVDTIYLSGKKFSSMGKFFFEVLDAGPVPVYIQHKGSLLPPGKTVGYGGTSQLAAATYISGVDMASGRFNLTLPADYIVNPAPIYWIKKENTLHDFLNEKQFLQLFPENNGRIRDYIKKNRLKIDNPGHLVEIVRYSGGL